MNYYDPFAAMQAAVDIVGESPHVTNKIAATLFSKSFTLSRTNYWPAPIRTAIGMETQIGNSSGSIHSEVACLLDSHAPVEGASLAVTDPPCPNCVKNFADAGGKEIFIDHKGFDKDWAQRRGDHFGSMSLQICEKAGISVHIIYRKDKKTTPIFEAEKNYVPAEDSPVTKEPVETLNEGVFQALIQDAYKKHQRRKFAVAVMKDRNGKLFAATARGHAVTGFTMEDPEDIFTIEKQQPKYTLFQEPVNRMLMYRARHGHEFQDGYFFTSQVPTSREQVNLVGAKISRVTVGDHAKARDAGALVAMRQLAEAKIISYD